MNGKEHPNVSFAKFTAHSFKKYFPVSGKNNIQYASNKTDPSFQFWKRDPLAIPITSENSFVRNWNIFIIIP